MVGVIGDFSGKPTTALPPLKDRKFVQIDRDNFNEVLERMRPALSFKVPNLLKGDGSEFLVELDFKSIEDFEPGAVARKIADISALLDVRNKLQELLTKADRSPELENLLEQIVQNENMRKELAADIEHDASTTSTATAPAASGLAGGEEVMSTDTKTRRVRWSRSRRAKPARAVLPGDQANREGNHPRVTEEPDGPGRKEERRLGAEPEPDDPECHRQARRDGFQTARRRASPP